MSKELTEQWRNGTLEENMYYVKLPEEIIIANIYQLKQLDLVNDADEIEVLAPVPSHSEYQALKDNCELTHTRLKGTHQKIAQLEKKLEIATKALKEIQEYTKEYSLPSYTGMLCYKALKEMEGVK